MEKKRGRGAGSVLSTIVKYFFILCCVFIAFFLSPAIKVVHFIVATDFRGTTQIPVSLIGMSSDKDLPALRCESISIFKMLCIVWLIKFHQFDRARQDAVRVKAWMEGGEERRQLQATIPGKRTTLLWRPGHLMNFYSSIICKWWKQENKYCYLGQWPQPQPQQGRHTHALTNTWKALFGHRIWATCRSQGEQDAARGSYADIYISKQLLLSCGSSSSQHTSAGQASSLLGILGIVRPAWTTNKPATAATTMAKRILSSNCPEDSLPKKKWKKRRRC